MGALRHAVAFALLLVLLAADAPQADGPPSLTVAIAGVELDMTPRQVRSVLGTPTEAITRCSARRRSSCKTGCAVQHVTYRYPDELNVLFTKRGTRVPYCKGKRYHADRVSTRSPLDRFESGIHVGSRYADLRNAIPFNLWCRAPHRTRWRARLRRPGNGTCMRDDGYPGYFRAATRFELKAFGVTRIWIALDYR